MTTAPSSGRARKIRALRHRGLIAGMLAIGAAPGFLLPVFAAVTLQPEGAAALLLLASLAQIVYGALGAPFETTLLMHLGRRYGSTGPEGRPPLVRLAGHAIARSGPLLVLAFGACVAGVVLLAQDLEFVQVMVLAACLSAQPLVQVAATPYSAHLYATRHLPAVYFGSVFRSGPALIALVIYPHPAVAALTLTAGEGLRWFWLVWQCRRSLRSQPRIHDDGIIPPTLRELSPQFLSSVAGQALPLVIQGIFALLGAQAITAGAIALRVWGAAFQVGTSTVAMPEVVTFARSVNEATQQDARGWIDRRAARLFLLSSALLLAGASVALIAFAVPGLVPQSIATGVWWSLVGLIGFPAAMVHFWAGRGLIALQRGWRVPALIMLGFAVGGVVCAATVPFVGGVGALIGQAANFIAMAAASWWTLRRLVDAT